MSCVSPWAFLLFLPLAVLVALRIRARRRDAFSFSSILPVKAAGKSFRQRLLWSVPALEIAAASLLIVALARPQEGVRRVEKTTAGIAIEMLMDISSSMSISMRSFDGGSSRLAVAKRVFADFVSGDHAGLPGRPNDMIGLTTFARYPNTVCPLTLGHDILRYFVRELEIEERPNEDGTAFGDALALGAARLQRVEQTVNRQSALGADDYRIRSKVAILLTDGENNCGRHLPREAAAMALKWGVRVYTIGFGERERSETELAAGGEDPPLTAAEKTLQEVAEMTGGFFRRAHDAESLRDVYAEIDGLEKTRFLERGYTDYRERFVPFVLGGLALLALALILKTTWLRKT